MNKFLSVFVPLFSITIYALGQGCSDAGFCSMGAMRPSQVYKRKIDFRLRELEVSYYSGGTKTSPTINAATFVTSMEVILQS